MEDRPRTTPYPLRMPDELRYKLEIAAQDGNRSLHAEIVARLEGSLHGFFDKDLTYTMLNAEVNRLNSELRAARESGNELMSKIQPCVEEHVESVMAKTGLTFAEALLLAVARGAALETAAPVVIVQVAKGTTFEEAKALMRAFTERAPEDANVFYEQTDVSKTRLLSSETDKAALVAKASPKLSKGSKQ